MILPYVHWILLVLEKKNLFKWSILWLEHLILVPPSTFLPLTRGRDRYKNYFWNNSVVFGHQLFNEKTIKNLLSLDGIYHQSWIYERWTNVRIIQCYIKYSCDRVWVQIMDRMQQHAALIVIPASEFGLNSESPFTEPTIVFKEYSPTWINVSWRKHYWVI